MGAVVIRILPGITDALANSLAVQSSVLVLMTRPLTKLLMTLAMTPMKELGSVAILSSLLWQTTNTNIVCVGPQVKCVQLEK